jgi:hypothetical protein
MLISVSGIIGSGKDTAASIIQQLTPYHNWEVKKFAGKLKQIASMLTGIPVEKFEDQEFKQTFLDYNWDSIKLVGPGRRQDGFYGPKTPVIEHMTVRDLLQKLGTEAMREGLHNNVWVNALFAEYRPINPEACQSMGNVLDYTNCDWPNWIITDTRFPNELESVKNRKGITMKIVRDSGNTLGTQHISETALNHVTDWDYVVENNGTLEELKQKLFDILSKENLIKYSGL